MAGLFTKLADSLDYLDGRVKQTIEGEVDEQDLDSIIDQRLKRKQRVDAAKDNAPFGSALSQAPTSSSQLYASPDASAANSTENFQTSSGVPTGSGTMLASSSPMARSSYTAPPGPSRGTTPPRQTSPARVTDVPGRPSPTRQALPPEVPISVTPSLSSQPQGRSSLPESTEGGEQTKPGFMGLSRSGGRGSRSPVNDQDVDELRARVKQLQREVKELNEENVDFEQKILGQERELKAAAEALEFATAKAVARESELLDEMKEIRSAKDVDRRQFNLAMQAKDKAVADAQGQLAGVKAELDSYVQQVASLRREMAATATDKQAMTRELDIARSNVERGVEGLRAELLAAQMTIDDMKAQHTSWMRQAQRREQELEGTNAELSESIAAKQREVETLKASFQQMGDSSHSTDLEMHRMQQELRATQGSLELERQHVVSLQREVRALQLEASSTQAAWRDEKETAESSVKKANARVAELERQVSEALRAARETRGPLKEELDQRLRTVSEQLVKKQEQLDASICETYALGARLKSAEQRVRGLEDQLVEARSAAGNGDGLFDLESAVDSPDSLNGVRNRTGRKNRPAPLRSISRLEPIAANPKVAQVVDTVDRFSVSLGHYLRLSPVARLAFITYFILLHLWAFFVLVFHTTRMEEIHGDVGGSFSNRQPGTGMPLGGS